MEEYLLSFFATHLTNSRISGTSEKHCVDFSNVRKDFKQLRKNEFLNKYSSMIKNEWQKNNPGLHRNWFDFKRLKKLLKESRFKNIRREYPQQSQHVEFCFSEFAKRPYMSVHIEGEK